MKTNARTLALAACLGFASASVAAPHGGGGHAAGGHAGGGHVAVAHSGGAHYASAHYGGAHYSPYYGAHYAGYPYYHNHNHSGFAIGLSGSYAGIGYYSGGYGASLSFPLYSGYSYAPSYYSAPPVYYYSTPIETYYPPQSPAAQPAPATQPRDFKFDGDPIKPSLKIPPARVDELPVPKVPADPEVPKLGPTPGVEMIALPTAKKFTYPAYGEQRSTRPDDTLLIRSK